MRPVKGREREEEGEDEVGVENKGERLTAWASPRSDSCEPEKGVCRCACSSSFFLHRLHDTNAAVLMLCSRPGRNSTNGDEDSREDDRLCSLQLGSLVNLIADDETQQDTLN